MFGKQIGVGGRQQVKPAGNPVNCLGIRLKSAVCIARFLRDGQDPLASAVAGQWGFGAIEMLLRILYWIVLVFAAAPLAYYLLSLYCVIAYFRELRKSHPARSVFTPPVSILKPVRGVDHQAYENFASFCQLDYPEYEIIFALADPDDPAVPVIEKLQADFPRRSIRLVKGVARLGTNSKVNSLCRLVREAKYDLLVMSDSDVRVEPGYLRGAAAPFANSAVGAVTAFCQCLGGGGIAADLDALGMCLDSVPGALVARKLEGKMQFAFGWTMATTKRHLSEIGGWEAMVNYHSDDFELGNRIARQGYRVELMSKPVQMVFPKETAGQYFRHELRWSIGLKNVRPAGYRGLILTHGLPWALFAAGVAAGAGWAAIAAAHLLAYFVLRLGLAWTTGVWGLRDPEAGKKLWLIPLRDAISFVVWVGGFFSDKITWRGLAYRVQNGQLFPMPGVILRKESVAGNAGTGIASSDNMT
jgi:ceramide glucosyltransferase